MPEHRFLMTVNIPDDHDNADDAEWWWDAAQGALREYGATEVTVNMPDFNLSPAQLRRIANILDTNSDQPGFDFYSALAAMEAEDLALSADNPDSVKRQQLAELEAQFDTAGGRGIDLAEQIDSLRAELSADAATCKHCGRIITRENGAWVDLNATGDDVVWRETCDSHDTFTAEHEPADDEPATGSIKTWTYSQLNPGGADVTHGLTFTGTDDEWAEHLADLVYQGIEPYNAKITAPVTVKLRPATPQEQSDYHDGHRTFPGAVEAEHGLLVPDATYEHVADAPDLDAYVAHVEHLLGNGEPDD